jgi:NTP pyrophosphatase (non-canonical NTP hydrolase)
MYLREYQAAALKFDQTPSTDPDGPGILVPLLGLAGESGELLSEYKKYLRDRDSHRLFKERIAEELGDLLWYVSNVASKFGLDMEDVAAKNIHKCEARWGVLEDGQQELHLALSHFDGKFPEQERLPREFQATFSDSETMVQVFMDGVQFGNDLFDNSKVEDGYRFHDIFHFSYAAVLGWSPVTRKLLGRKRKSNPEVDSIEDGGRAIAIEEGISALVFAYAKDHAYLRDVTTIDYDLLRTISNMCSHLEVSRHSLKDWQKAILTGYDAWRMLTEGDGGNFYVNLNERSVRPKVT